MRLESTLAAQGASSMTTPNPTDITTGVPWTVFVPVVVAFAGMVGVALRLLYRALQKRIEEKTAHNHELVVQLVERVAEYFAAHERLRDKWDEFLREYLKIDSTRGQKVDALFRVVDHMQKAVDRIPRNMNDRLEESFTHSMSELKLYVRDIMARERSEVK
jgi:hypothetical protein